MTVGKYYIGDQGPFYYDDTVDLLDPDGDFPGQQQGGFVTDGPVKTTRAATDADDLVRKEDYDTDQTASVLLTKLKTVDGSGSGLDADLLDGEEGTYYAKQSDIDNLETWQATGVSGTFTTADAKTVTVTNSLITSIV